MSIVPLEKKEEYKAVIRRVIAMNPTISVLELQRRLGESSPPLALSRDYLTSLVKEIRLERIKEVEDQTKEDLFAQVQDVVIFVNNQLRAIANEEKLVYTKLNDKGLPSEKAEVRIFAQQNRIKALNSVIVNLEKLVNLKMDLGIIERKVGTMDFKVIDMMSALKKIRNGDYSTPLEQLIGEGEVIDAVPAGSN